MHNLTTDQWRQLKHSYHRKRAVHTFQLSASFLAPCSCFVCDHSTPLKWGYFDVVSPLSWFSAISEMGNSTSSSLLLTQENIKQISSETGFTASQIERLWSRFTSLDTRQRGFLSREDFLRIPGARFNNGSHFGDVPNTITHHVGSLATCLNYKYTYLSMYWIYP